MCNRCDSTTQEADLAEDLVIYGETYGFFIKILCYLGGTLSGVDLATIVYNQKWMD